ncbi:hypothetical protein [Flammeovirga sp. EKP202]|uniref:hypothetical protein n=1 Tax=Flammeovirga sp. EKP202 TaxID=2770592 RepID=UPI00165FFC97|nr:hypothetical protein [Flammeovirga sp. EKP202]MBD0403507.1 hypothetical protein [Flammeovirga sp. EKP202]
MKLLSVLSLSLLLFIASCSTTNEEKIIDAEVHNKTLQDSFELTSPLDSKSGMEAFISHFSTFKIEENNQVRNITEEELLYFYNLTLEKIAQFEIPSNAKKAPTREEIRSALLNECGGYFSGLDVACKTAVWIAYYLG